MDKNKNDRPMVYGGHNYGTVTIHGVTGNGATDVLPMTLPSVGRFSEFFHR